MFPSRLDWMTGSLLDAVVFTQRRDCKQTVYAACCMQNWKMDGGGRHWEKNGREVFLSSLSGW